MKATRTIACILTALAFAGCAEKEDHTPDGLSEKAYMLVQMQKSGYLISDYRIHGDAGSDDFTIWLAFHRHPVIDRYADDFPSGISELSLSQREDGCFDLNEDDKTVRVLLTGAGNVQLTKWNTSKEGCVSFDSFMFRNVVLEAGHDTDDDGYLSMTEAGRIKELHMAGKGIHSLTGIEAMKGLKYVDFRDNPKIALSHGVDFSAPHQQLVEIRCDSGCRLDIRGCPGIVFVNCHEDDEPFNSEITVHPDQVAMSRHGSCRNMRVADNRRHVSAENIGDSLKWMIQNHFKGNGVKIQIRLEDAADIDVSSGAAQKMLETVAENMFRHEPFASYRECFDIEGFIRIERNRGARTEEGTKAYDSRAVMQGTNTIILGFGNVESRPVYFKETCHMPLHDLSFNMMMQLLGHTFADLSPESTIHPDVTVPESFKDLYYHMKSTPEGEPVFSRNISYTDDPELVPWARMLQHPDYKDRVGIYEGALYGSGLFKSSRYGMMNDVNPYSEQHYNTVGRYEIFKRIMKDSGLMGRMKWSGYPDILLFTQEEEDRLWEAFLEYDTINRNLPI